MKTLFMALVFVSSVAFADTYLHPTIPGTDIRDYDKPSLIIKDNGTIKQSIPGTTVEDYGKHGYKESEGRRLVPTIPGTDMEDYGAQGYIYED